MLSNSLVAGALATCYVLVLVLQLNPTLPLNPARLVGFAATIGLFYTVHLTAIFYVVLVVRQLLAQRWHEASFEPVLQEHRRRFEATGTEEGIVMASTLAYVISDLRTSRRAAILDDFRSNGRILQLFTQGVAELSTALTGGRQ